MSDILILQHVRPEPPAMISDVLSAHDLSIRTVRVHRGEPVPKTLEADGLVVLGGPMGIADIDERPHLRSECGLIEEAVRYGVPLLGVCLGSQLLAHVLGGDVQPAPDKEIGWKEVTLKGDAEEDALFQGVDNSFSAFHWHGDAFALPDGAVSLARTAQTAHQAFRYGARAYGLLFHLEVTPKTVAWMTKAFQDELSDEGLDGAAIRRDAMSYEPEIRSLAETVFGRWGELVSAP